MKRKLFISLLLAILVLSFTACSNNTSSPPTESSKLNQNKGDSSILNSSALSPSSQAEGKINLDRAKEIALNHANVKEADISGYRGESDRDDGMSYYEIEFNLGSDRYEYHIHVETGKILEAEKNDKNILEISYKKIPEAEAKKIALNHADVTEDNISRYKIEFDVDDGVPSYEIEFISGGYEYDYDINSSDGSIIKSEKEIID